MCSVAKLSAIVLNTALNWVRRPSVNVRLTETLPSYILGVTKTPPGASTMALF
jgi:hypothetical protein